MANHRREITPIAGRQWRSGSDGHRTDAAIREALGSTTREVEKLRRLLGVRAFECFCVREQTSRERLCCGSERPAEKLTPSDRADRQRFAGSEPAYELRLLRTPRHERINQEVRVEVYHGARPGEPLPACIRHCIFPRRRTLSRQPHLVLQLPEHLEGLGR
jgi:hypothetical protein